MIAVWQIASSTGLLKAGFRLHRVPWSQPSGIYCSAVNCGRMCEVSAGRAISGLLVGGGLGLLLGLSNGSSKTASTLLDTTLQMIRNISGFGLNSTGQFWFGIDESAKLFLVAIGVFFPIYINTYHGIRSVDPQLIEMGKSYGLSSLAAL